MNKGKVLLARSLTLNVDLYSMILGSVSIAGSAPIVTLVRLLDVPDRKLCVVVEDVVPANWHRTSHLGP